MNFTHTTKIIKLLQERHRSGVNIKAHGKRNPCLYSPWFFELYPSNAIYHGIDEVNKLCTHCAFEWDTFHRKDFIICIIKVAHCTKLHGKELRKWLVLIRCNLPAIRSIMELWHSSEITLIIIIVCIDSLNDNCNPSISIE